MSMLERAVVDLADALDSLETRITETLATKEETSSIGPSTARHLRTAEDRTEFASGELAKAIDELKSLVGDSAKTKAKDHG